MGFIDPQRLVEVEPKPGWHGRFFHSEHMTFAYYVIDRGATLPPHSHENEEVWHVTEGALNLTLAGQTTRVPAGCAMLVPAGVVHAAAANEPCRVIVADYPARHEVAGIRI